MNYQDTFNKVARHLLAQDTKSEDENGNCLYRGPDGLKCAIGVLIPDDKYYKTLEGIRAESSVVSKILKASREDRIFLKDLQQIHDDYDPPVWKDRLSNLANSYALSDQVLEEFP